MQWCWLPKAAPRPWQIGSFRWSRKYKHGKTTLSTATSNAFHEIFIYLPARCRSKERIQLHDAIVSSIASFQVKLQTTSSRQTISSGHDKLCRLRWKHEGGAIPTVPPQSCVTTRAIQPLLHVKHHQQLNSKTATSSKGPRSSRGL